MGCILSLTLPLFKGLWYAGAARPAEKSEPSLGPRIMLPWLGTATGATQLRRAAAPRRRNHIVPSGTTVSPTSVPRQSALVPHEESRAHDVATVRL